MNQAVPISVLIDDQALIAQVRGGISRNLVDLLQASRAINDTRIKTFTLGRRSGNEYAIASGIWKQWPNDRLAKVIEKAKSRFGPRQRYRAKSDIVHHTYYFDAYLDKKLGKKSVVSVYDMIPEIYPDLFPAGNPHLAKHKFVSASSAVMCISETTKIDLCERFGTDPTLVRVVPLGVSRFWTPDKDPTHRQLNKAPFVLFVGGRTGYKDFDVLLKAMRLVQWDIHLVVAGSPPSMSERKLLADMGISNRVSWKTPNDSELRDLYRSAAAFVFPSRYEGFGLPTLEAMACGCPVITSDAAAHVEVGGDASLRFSCGDSEELAALIQRLLESTSLSGLHSQLGLQRAMKFSWWESAKLTHEIYTSL